MSAPAQPLEGDRTDYDVCPWCGRVTCECHLETEAEATPDSGFLPTSMVINRPNASLAPRKVSPNNLTSPPRRGAGTVLHF